MLTAPNEETSECFNQESPPLAPELDSGTPGEPATSAGNQPNKTNAAGLVSGALSPRASRRVREHIDANIAYEQSKTANSLLAGAMNWTFDPRRSPSWKFDRSNRLL